jgi:hypothetical protein
MGHEGKHTIVRSVFLIGQRARTVRNHSTSPGLHIDPLDGYFLHHLTPTRHIYRFTAFWMEALRRFSTILQSCFNRGFYAKGSAASELSVILHGIRSAKNICSQAPASAWHHRVQIMHWPMTIFHLLPVAMKLIVLSCPAKLMPWRDYITIEDYHLAWMSLVLALIVFLNRVWACRASLTKLIAAFGV